MTKKLTQKMLMENWEYSEKTGIFIRVYKNGKRKKALCLHSDGSIRISVYKRTYRAHRLAWLYVYGVWPDGFIDHINGDQKDNRIKNLRIATDSENKRNVGKRSHNTSGYKGVTWDKTNKKWLAHATYNGKSINLGRYDTPLEAYKAYNEFAVNNYGEFYRKA